jgi:threonine synthase
MSAVQRPCPPTVQAQPQRNPNLRGLCCLRCARAFALVGAPLACPVCLARGHHISLRAQYTTAPDVTSQLPYLDGVKLGEGNTPLLAASAVGSSLGLANLWVKDESRNPTGSHKDRMSAIGVTQALDRGAHTVVLASSGNAAISAARYARAAGLACEVATYSAMPEAYRADLARLGARCFEFVDNAQRWAFVAQRALKPGYFALTNYHLPALGSAPLAIEGYKAIAHECFAAHCLPQHVFVPTARGDLAWGIYAGWLELLEAGQIARLPRIWVVEPFARLSQVLQGGSLHTLYPGHTEQFSCAGHTTTYLQWEAAQASGGGAVVVSDAAARAARKVLQAHAISAELCAAAAFSAAQQLLAKRQIASSDQVLVILTASAKNDPSWPDPQ